MKWTLDHRGTLLDLYFKLGREGIPQIAKHFNVSNEAVISKLVYEGVYISDRKKSIYTGKKPETKEQLVKKLEDMLSLDLTTLEKANKLVILNLIRKFEGDY